MNDILGLAALLDGSCGDQPIKKVLVILNSSVVIIIGCVFLQVLPLPQGASNIRKAASEWHDAGHHEQV